MKKGIITIIIGAVVILLGVYMIILGKDGAKTPVTPVTNTGSVSQVAGCYVAKISNDVYSLNIPYVENTKVTGTLSYSNYEKDSSSGTFVGSYNGIMLVGDYTFFSEGMRSERQVAFKKVGDDFVQGFGPVTVVGDRESLNDINNLSYDNSPTFIKSTSCNGTISYMDTDMTFTFKYNPSFVVTNAARTLTKDWRIDAPANGRLFTTVVVPKAYLPGSNFSEAKLTVGASTDPVAIGSCTTMPEGNNITSSNVNINNKTFTKVNFGDAAAGNLYDTTSYRGILDGDCYTIEYTIHSTNIGNYPPEQGIKEFNTAALKAELDQVAQSFVFLVNSN